MKSCGALCNRAQHSQNGCELARSVSEAMSFAKPLSRLCHTPRGNLAVSLAINCNISAISIWLRFIWPNSRNGPGHRLSLALPFPLVRWARPVRPFANLCGATDLTGHRVAKKAHWSRCARPTMTYGCVRRAMRISFMWLPTEGPVPLPECFALLRAVNFLAMRNSPLFGVALFVCLGS